MKKTEQTPDNRNTVKKRLFLNIIMYLAIALVLYCLVFVSFIPMRRNVYNQAEQALTNELYGETQCYLLCTDDK